MGRQSHNIWGRPRDFLSQKGETCDKTTCLPNPRCPHVNAGMETFFGILRRKDLLHNWYNSAEVFEKTIKEYTESFSLKRPSQKL